MTMATTSLRPILETLNPQQQQAVTHGTSPLLIVAGAGTGKTATLAHRVAWLIAGGVNPSNILLLTFTRRAAAELLHRADLLLRRLGELDEEAGQGKSAQMHLRSTKVWGGTFHAVATRLLRQYGKAIGLAPDFTVHDRGDSEDLMNVVRTEIGLAKNQKRFPKKGACMDIYSWCINARESLENALSTHFQWCVQWHDELKQLFEAYVDRKEAMNVLDYDDLLLFWHELLGHEQAGGYIRRQFQCVLVDEYQDTNRLQAEIIYRLCPDGRGLTVVGDDAQSIYSFRAATVRNILEFPKRYPDAAVITLEKNYRSTMVILQAANQVISQARERFTKNLWSDRKQGQRPWVVYCEDDYDQANFVIQQILAHRESGIDLRRQAVLFRASYHSMVLEGELSRRNIPFHKYGGLKFVETAHVKDLLAFLRLAENPKDVVSGMRILPLLPQIGLAKARKLMDQLVQSEGKFSVWRQWTPPAEAAKMWTQFVDLMESLSSGSEPLSSQVHQVRVFYSPLLESNYDYPQGRLRDLEQLEVIASRYRSRAQMLLDMAIDPPSSTQDLAGKPLQDDDYLVLSTIHSAKGLEWDAVYVIHATDGNIPSDMATGSSEGVEEELRLFYVALTRAKSWLYVTVPTRYYTSWSSYHGQFGMPQITRFLPKNVLKSFETRITGLTEDEADEQPEPAGLLGSTKTVRRRTKDIF